MGTKKLVHEFIYHPNVFRNLNVGEAIYAAKKPSRFGTVQVKMLDIPHDDIEVRAIKSQAKEISTQVSVRKINLEDRISTQQKVYKESLSSSKDRPHKPTPEEVEADLEI